MGKGKHAAAEMRAYHEDKKGAADIPLKPKKNKRLEEKREAPSLPENQKESEREAPRFVSRPEDVAGLVFMQIDQVNARKDELTIAIKGLSDLTRQLVKAYGEHTNAIQRLQQRVRDMENEKK